MEIQENKVYNCDCIELMQEMVEQNIKVDCVITDPPYLMSYKTGYRQDKEDRFCDVIPNDDNEKLIKDYILLCSQIMKDDTALYCFCNANKIDVFKQEIEKYFSIKNIIVWVKNNWSAGDLQAQLGKQYEFCIYANKGRRVFNGEKRLTDVWFFDRCSGNEQVHQNQKPLPLIYQMLKLSTNVGDLVFDGFMGSGTTAVACKRLERNYIGAEIDEYYYNVCEQRLAQENNQLSLFDL